MKWYGPLVGNALDRTQLETLVKKGTPGVYLWRRVQRYDSNCLISPQEFMAWIDRGVRAPLLKTEGLTLLSSSKSGTLSVRPSYIQTGHFRVGGGELGGQKRVQLEAMNDSTRLAAYSAFIDATLAFGPAIYVGESECLCTRITQHISGNSSLSSRLDDLGLDLADVALNYCTDDLFLDSDFRTLFEATLTHLLGAPLTFRAG